MTYRLVKAKLETAAKEAPTGPFRMVVGYRAKNSQDEPDDQVLRLAQSTAKSKGKSLGTHSAYGTNYEYELGDNLSEAVAKAKALSASIVDHNKRVAPDLRIKTSKYFILVMDSFGSQVYPKKTTMSGVETAADAGDKWWKSLDKKQQDAYLKLHPNSKYGKKKGKAPSNSLKVGKALTKPKVAIRPDKHPTVKGLGSNQKALDKELDKALRKIASFGPTAEGKDYNAAKREYYRILKEHRKVSDRLDKAKDKATRDYVLDTKKGKWVPPGK